MMVGIFCFRGWAYTILFRYRSTLTIQMVLGLSFEVGDGF
jgi:hypothetical protein